MSTSHTPAESPGVVLVDVDPQTGTVSQSGQQTLQAVPHRAGTARQWVEWNSRHFYQQEQLREQQQEYRRRQRELRRRELQHELQRGRRPRQPGSAPLPLPPLPLPPLPLPPPPPPPPPPGRQNLPSIAEALADAPPRAAAVTTVSEPHHWLPREVRPLAEREGQRWQQQRDRQLLDTTTRHLDRVFHWAVQVNTTQRNAYALLEAQVGEMRRQADAHGYYLELWRHHILAGLPPPPPPDCVLTFAQSGPPPPS